MFSVKQVEEGVIDITKLDTSVFAKKDDVTDKESFESLKEVVAGKLDKEPVHQHDIKDIVQLSTKLGEKLDSNQKYSYSTILSNPEEINYLNIIKTQKVEVSESQTSDGYTFSIDSVGDLKVMINGVVIATYVKSTNSWVFNGVNLTSFINETNEVLQNHYEAIKTLAALHNINDNDNNDGNRFT